VADFRVAAEAFLAVEVVFREEVAVLLEVREASPAVAAVSPAVAISLEAAVFLAAAAVVPPGAAAVFLVAAVAAFPGATIVSPAQAALVPLDISMFRAILHCSPISADRGRVAVECHRVQPEVNQATDVHRWEEARHSCRLAIDRVVIWEGSPRNFPLAMKAEHVQATLHPSVRVEATPEIFSGSQPGLALALRSVGQSRISPVSFPRIVLVKVKSPPLRSNAQIGVRAR
jgi:hypothetical protein